MSIDQSEHTARVTRVRERMRTAALDGLVVVDPANMYYLTGYDAWSFYMPQLLFVPLEGEPLLILRAMDANGAHRSATLPRERILGYPESWVHQRDKHPFEWSVQALRDHGLVSDGRIGFESEAHFFTPRMFLALQASAPEWTLVDSGELVNWVRLVKSDAELALIRAAGTVCTAAMLAGVDAIHAGARQNDVAAAIAKAQAAGTAEIAGDYPAIVPMLPTGESADTPHMTYSGRVLVPGEAVSIELAGTHARYHAPLARTVALGGSTPQLDSLASITADGLTLVLDAIRPGLEVAEVHAHWQQHLAKHGLEKASRLGYSIGIGYPPDWGERTVSIRGDDHTVLESGMCFHIIAGMWMDGYGAELSESIAVTDTGIELLTNVPRELLRR